jgi:hypothetical protein
MHAMFIHRTNRKTPATGDDSFKAMRRHVLATSARLPVPAKVAPAAAPAVPKLAENADVVYGARAIAGYLFGDCSVRARRRVFCLAAHYKERDERAGFFKLKGALCLSKKQWLAFHGLA